MSVHRWAGGYKTGTQEGRLRLSRTANMPSALSQSRTADPLAAGGRWAIIRRSGWRRSRLTHPPSAAMIAKQTPVSDSPAMKPLATGIVYISFVALTVFDRTSAIIAPRNMLRL